MRIQCLNKKMFLAGMQASFNYLRQRSDELDQLNVFPVPDGDTGFNMVRTFQAGINAIPSMDGRSMRDALQEMSRRMLLASRGNSGVILSQFYRGMVEAVPCRARLNAGDLAAMLEKGRERAYAAVSKPVEGTMLTIISGLAESARRECAAGNGDIVAMLKRMRQDGYRLLFRTPDMLPVLAEAGVVDAGGQGMLYIFDGILEGLEGKQDLVKESVGGRLLRAWHRSVRRVRALWPSRRGWRRDSHRDVWEGDITHRYCAEFLVVSPRKKAAELGAELAPLGDSVEVAEDSSALFKVHLHTNYPERAFELGRASGTVERVKLDDMKVQQSKFLARRKREKRVAVLAVSPGQGFSRLLMSLGCESVVTYGRRLPSARRLLRAVERIPAVDVLLLPNHKNIVPVAQVVAGMSRDKRVAVIPTSGVIQGLAALYGFSPEASIEDNERTMSAPVAEQTVINITAAGRDAAFGTRKLKKGDYMALCGDALLAVSATPQVALSTALAAVPDERRKEVMNLTIYKGRHARQADAADMAKAVKAEYPDLEVEVADGGQCQYEYIVVLE